MSRERYYDHYRLVAPIDGTSEGTHYGCYRPTALIDETVLSIGIRAAILDVPAVILQLLLLSLSLSRRHRHHLLLPSLVVVIFICLPCHLAAIIFAATFKKIKEKKEKKKKIEIGYLPLLPHLSPATSTLSLLSPSPHLSTAFLSSLICRQPPQPCRCCCCRLICRLPSSPPSPVASHLNLIIVVIATLPVGCLPLRPHLSPPLPSLSQQPPTPTIVAATTSSSSTPSEISGRSPLPHNSVTAACHCGDPWLSPYCRCHLRLWPLSSTTLAPSAAPDVAALIGHLCSFPPLQRPFAARCSQLCHPCQPTDLTLKLLPPPALPNCPCYQPTTYLPPLLYNNRAILNPFRSLPTVGPLLLPFCRCSPSPPLLVVSPLLPVLTVAISFVTQRGAAVALVVCLLLLLSVDHLSSSPATVAT
ncbi:hypothetical protein BHE74_00022334 [Ensete ventricosum]|nr:hypothetical protein BHE74_00022334 [Ensete ventricosum]